MKHKPDESPPLAFLADVDITSFLVVELLQGLFKGRYWALALLYDTGREPSQK